MYFGRNTLNIAFNNARSFRSHFKSISQNDIVLKQDISIFAESRLRHSDRTTDYAIDDYITIRADQKNTPSTPHYGIIAYVKNSIKVQKILYLSHETLDILLIVVEYNQATNLNFWHYTIVQETHIDTLNRSYCKLPKLQRNMQRKLLL